MNLKPFFSDSISSNIYLLEGDKTLLIDAGMEPFDMKGIDILILTHSHFDHSAMARDIQKKTGCEVWMSSQEAEFFQDKRADASAAKYFDFPVDLDFTIDKRLEDGDIIDLGTTKLRAIVTPGHTPGGLCLYESQSKALFSGDTVFASGFGRYDLLGGDIEALRSSIKRLAELDVAELYPGHGPALKSGVNKYIKSILV